MTKTGFLILCPMPNSLKYFFTKVLGQAFSSGKRFWTKKNSQIITFQSHWVFFADESQITATGSQKCHPRLKFFWDFLEKQFEEISTKPDVRRRRQQNDVFIDLSKATETKKMPKLNRKRPKQSKLFFQMFRKPIFLSGASKARKRWSQSQVLSNRAKTESARNPSHPTYRLSARFGSPPPQTIANREWNQPASRCRPLQSRNTRRTIRNGAALRPFEIISMLGQTKGPVTRIRTIEQRAQSIIRKRAAPTSIFLVWPDPKEIRRTAWWTKLLF